MLTADRRRKEPRTVDRPAHIKAASKASSTTGMPKPAGGQAATGFAAFRAMAAQHSAFKAPPVMPEGPVEEPVAATALPPAEVDGSVGEAPSVVSGE